MANEELKKTYAYLKTLNDSLVRSGEDKYVRDGSWKKYNEVIDQLVKTADDEMFKEFKVTVRQGSFGTRHDEDYVYLEEYRRKVYNAASYLYETKTQSYTAPPTAAPLMGDTTPRITQHVESNQNTSVNIEFNVTIRDIYKDLARAELKYTDTDSSENKFIKRVNDVLPTVKTSMELFKTILECAVKFGLDPKTILSIFS